MDLETYLANVKDKHNKRCKIYYENGQIDEGVYLEETPNIKEIGMVIRMTGDTKQKLKHVGISDVNPNIENGDTLEVKDKISALISAIRSIEFID